MQQKDYLEKTDLQFFEAQSEKYGIKAEEEEENLSHHKPTIINEKEEEI